MKPVIVRGGGDVATGTIHRLCRSGYPVIVLECERPSAIRRRVAFCQAVYEKTMTVEGITCTRAESLQEALQAAAPQHPMLLVDPRGDCLKDWKPDILIDGILAKKNLGTRRDMAALTIALGPGFEAGKDVDYVIETKRGHYLGRILEKGTAIPNTGVPGVIGGYGKERVIHAPQAGIFHQKKDIGDWVDAGEEIGWIQTGEEEPCAPAGGQSADRKVPVRTEISGVLRGIIEEGFPVTEHFKLADVDPRVESAAYCDLISDKARCIAGSVLELVCGFEKRMEKAD